MEGVGGWRALPIRPKPSFLLSIVQIELQPSKNQGMSPQSHGKSSLWSMQMPMWEGGHVIILLLGYR